MCKLDNDNSNETITNPYSLSQDSPYLVVYISSVTASGQNQSRWSEEAPEGRLILLRLPCRDVEPGSIIRAAIGFFGANHSPFGASLFARDNLYLYT